MPKFVAASVNVEVSREIGELAQLMTQVNEFEAYVGGAEWPEGAEWNPTQTDIRWRWITVNIPPAEGRAWRGLDGTAGIVYKVRKFFAAQKLTRSIDRQGNTSFMGEFRVVDNRYTLNILLGRQLPDTCKLVEEEETVTVTRTKYHTVCE